MLNFAKMSLLLCSDWKQLKKKYAKLMQIFIQSNKKPYCLPCGIAWFLKLRKIKPFFGLFSYFYYLLNKDLHLYTNKAFSIHYQGVVRIKFIKSFFKINCNRTINLIFKISFIEKKSKLIFKSDWNDWKTL